MAHKSLSKTDKSKQKQNEEIYTPHWSNPWHPLHPRHPDEPSVLDARLQEPGTSTLDARLQEPHINP
jgi:hypothetical protein